MPQAPAFSLKQYLLGQHNADELQVERRMKIAAVWAQRNRHRSIREFVK